MSMSSSDDEPPPFRAKADAGGPAEPPVQHDLMLPAGMASAGGLAPTRLLLDQLPDPVFVLDDGGRFAYLSAPWRTVSGRETRDSVGVPLLSFVDPLDVTEVRLQLFNLLEGLAPVWRGAFRLVTIDGGRRWVEMHVAAAAQGPFVVQLAGILRDVTAEREREERLMHLALHDALVDVPNRTLLLDRLQSRQARARRQPKPLFALALVDLNNFKVINDMHGHRTGDEALRVAARRLVGAVRASDTVARIGGDEFVVLFDETHGPRDSLRLAQRLKAAVDLPLSLKGSLVPLTCSVGAVTSNTQFDHLEQLLDFADVAMYHAKHRGSGVALYDLIRGRPLRSLRRPWGGRHSRWRQGD